MVIRSSSATRSRRRPPGRKATEQRDPAEMQQAAKRALVKLRPSSLIFMLLAIVGSFHAMSMIGIESYRILTNSAQIEHLNSDIAVIKEEIAALDAVIEHTDDVYMEQLARCQGFIFPNETRYITDLPAEATRKLACHPLQ